MLLQQQTDSKNGNPYIWTHYNGQGQMCKYSVSGALRRISQADAFALGCVHSCRHTCATRLGMSGADAFTIMRIMGWSNVQIAMRYVHPTPEALGKAIGNMVDSTWFDKTAQQRGNAGRA